MFCRDQAAQPASMAHHSTAQHSMRGNMNSRLLQLCVVLTGLSLMWLQTRMTNHLSKLHPVESTAPRIAVKVTMMSTGWRHFQLNGPSFSYWPCMPSVFLFPY